MNYKCEKVYTKLGRFYRSPITKLWYPSVTTVVNHESKEFFKEWSKNPENVAKADRAKDLGEQLHKNAENYLLGKDVVFRHADDEAHFNNIKHIKDHISNIVCQEEILFSDELRVAGQVDLIANYNDVLSIIDYKTSSKVKKREWIHNYFDQTFCYALMAEERLNLTPKQLVIIMTVESSGCHIFVDKTKSCAAHFLDTFRKYWKQNNFIEIQDLCEEEYHKKI